MASCWRRSLICTRPAAVTLMCAWPRSSLIARPTVWPVGELFRVSLLVQGRPADAGRRAPAVGDRRPLLSAAPLATAADRSARRARERKPGHQSEDPVRTHSAAVAGHLRGYRRARAVPYAHACCLAGGRDDADNG